MLPALMFHGFDGIFIGFWIQHTIFHHITQGEFSDSQPIVPSHLKPPVPHDKHHFI